MDINLDIVIFQKRTDPVENPSAAGSFWINMTSGAFFVSREETLEGETVLRWFKEGNISETQFRQLFDAYAPLATLDELESSGTSTRVSITPRLLRQAIVAIAPDEITEGEFNQLLQLSLIHI